MTFQLFRHIQQARKVFLARMYRTFSRVIYLLKTIPAQFVSLKNSEKIMKIENRLGIFYARPFTDTITKTDPNFERNLHHWITKAPEGLLVDVGANVGFYTNLALTRGNATGALAFEPNPSVYPLLVKNISANDLHANAIHAAVSKSTGSMTLAPNTIHTGASNVCGGSGVSVKSIDLDTYLREKEISAGKIGCIKIDIEGHELAALEGMQKTLQNVRPGTHLFVEISEYDEPAEKTRAFIKWNGFELTEQSGKNYLYKKT